MIIPFWIPFIFHHSTVNLNLLCSKQRFPVDFPFSLKPIHWTSCLEIQFQLIDRHICIFHRFAWLNHVKSQLQQASPPHVAPSSPVVPAWGLSPASPVAESEDLRLRRSVPYWGLWSALYCSNSWDGIGVFLMAQMGIESSSGGGLHGGLEWWWMCGIIPTWYDNDFQVSKLFWLVVWNHGILWLFIQLGISSSQLTNSYFSEGWLNHQPVLQFSQIDGGTAGDIWRIASGHMWLRNPRRRWLHWIDPDWGMVIQFS